jgi:shikimate dehydrogenase
MPDDKDARARRLMSSKIETWLVGLIGRGIGGSHARQMHEREAAALDMQLVYRVIDFDRLAVADDDLGKIIAMVEAMGFAGVNITHPYKQAVIAHLDTLSSDAETLGAVNTVRFADGKRAGHNTDWSGFATCVETQLGNVLSGKVAQIGAGGAGSATAYAALRKGASELAIYDRDVVKAQELAIRLAPAFPDQSIKAYASAQDTFDGATGVIQTSPIGMTSHPGLPFDPDTLTPDQWLADIIYFPTETELVMKAKARGVRAIGGSAMAIHQAAAAFEIFTGQAPDAQRMLSDFHQSLAV